MFTNINDKRSAIVAGATGGSGVQAALKLAALGLDLLALGSDQGELDRLVETISGTAGQVAVQQVDLTVPDELRRVVREAKSWISRVDVLVCNAAPQHVDPGFQLSLGDLGGECYIGLEGARTLADELLPGMVAKRWGRIIYLTPRCGRSELARLSGIDTGRIDFLELTRKLATEVGRSNITVNGIMSVWADRNSVHSALAEQARYLGIRKTEIDELVRARDSSAGTGGDQEIGALIEHLLSPAGREINGLMIPLPGRVIGEREAVA